MAASNAGDVLIVLGEVAASRLLFGRSMSALRGSRGRIAIIALGFVAGILADLSCLRGLQPNRPLRCR